MINVDALAKLNISLRVMGQQADGYHSIETLFLALSLSDRLEIDADPATPGIRLEVGGSFAVPADDTNLCVAAARSWYSAVGRAPACRIRLEKRIPVAAGLGGGSSDAAAVLLGLNRLAVEPLAPTALLAVAGRLGSDVPFFVSGAALALGWERGRRLLPLAPPPRRPVLLLMPDFGVRAADAYAWWRAAAAGGGDPGAAVLPTAHELADWSSLEGLASNDLQAPVTRHHPELSASIAALRDLGAGVSLLCGSGSCVAGIFPEEADRDAALHEVRRDARVPEAWGAIATWTVGPGRTSAG